MEIYVGSLSPHTTRNDVVTFLKSFARDARISMVDQKLDNDQRAYYAIADFDSDKLALKAIKKLSGGVLRGEKVMLREFFRRNYSNERRALNWREKPWSGLERRNHERRKKLIPVGQSADDFGIQVEEQAKTKNPDPATVKISAYNNMARKL
jgi:RNA recognition motif-containing protein